MFQCPSCGSSLSPEGNHAQIKCPYCGNTVIVPPELREPEPVGIGGASPINIVVGESGASFQMPESFGAQSKPINVVLGETQIAGLSNPMLPATQWMRTAIWIFVIVMIVSTVVPVVCSLLGFLARLGDSQYLTSLNDRIRRRTGKKVDASRGVQLNARIDRRSVERPYTRENRD